MPSDLLRAALDHAARGWRVFPLRPGDKRPAIKDWETRATTDPRRIRRAWLQQPMLNIGVACGPSGLVVIDLDTADHGSERPGRWDLPGVRDGVDVLAAVAEEQGQEPPFATFSVQTASGGEHLYFTAPIGRRIGNSAGKIGWLVDVRGSGVVAAVAVSSRVRVLIEALSAAMRRARSSTLCVSSPDAVDAAGAAFGGLRR